MLTFLIMAGGSGERFWPLSTKQKPKQLLKVFSSKSLIKLTYDRILPLTNKDNIFIAINEVQIEALKEELDIDDKNIIIEPMFKDTAAAIAYGSTIIEKYVNDPTIVVLASDHLIFDEEEFRNVLLIASKTAQEGNIVTLGIKPSYPEVGYGYIEVSNPKLNVPTKSLGFKEKPKYEIAKEYFESGNFLWNSGMFIFKYDVIMSALNKYSKGHYDTIMEIKGVINENEGIKTSLLAKPYFEKFEKKSIDFAVMEKADNIMVIPSSFGWNDVGSYTAFDELFEKDINKNVVRNTNCISVDSKNNIVISNGSYQRVSLLDVENMVIAITKDEILVCNKNNVQDIKKIIKML